MAIAKSLPPLLKSELHPEVRQLSKTDLARMDHDLDKATEYLIEQHRRSTGHKLAHCITAVNCGQLLNRQKGLMNHGQFRAWAEKGCGLTEWNVTYYMRLAKLAEKFNADPAKMSARAVMRLENKSKTDKEAIRKAREKKSKKPTVDQRRDTFKNLADQIDTALEDDKAIFGEVLVPRLKAALKEYGKTAERQKAVRGSEQ